MKLKILTLSFLLLCLVTSATVRNVPVQYSTIQLALNSCLANDTILVQPGIYKENIVWPSVYGLKLLSAGDSSNTIIDGDKTGRVITFNSSSAVDSNTVVKGFRITHGYLMASHAYGGGILVSNCSATFLNLDIFNNHIGTPAWDWGYGAGVHCDGSQSVFKNCIIHSNGIDSASWGYGGGIYATESNLKLTDVVIENNSVTSSSWCYGPGLHATFNSDITMVNTVIRGNVSKSGATWYYGGGFYVNQSDAILTNCLVVGNKMGTGGTFYRGSGIWLRDSVSIALMNCTVSDNGKSDNSTVSEALWAADSKVDVTNSILWNAYVSSEITNQNSSVAVGYSCVRNGYSGINNISLNPLFVSGTDFHLQNASPCVDTATLIGAPLFDLEYQPRPMPLGGKPDMGCYELYQVSSALIENDVVNASLVLFPNPAQSHLNIVVDKSQFINGFKLQLIDPEGRIMINLTGESYESVLDVSALLPGVYFVRIITDAAITTGRFVKN